MQIIIAAHGFLAKELLTSVEMICGKQINVHAVEFLSGENTDILQQKYSEYIKNISNKEILFLVDLFGGTPYNAASAIAIKNSRVEVLTGVSLPMLLEILMLNQNEKITIEDIVKSVNKNKNNYIRSARQVLREIPNDEEEL